MNADLADQSGIRSLVCVLDNAKECPEAAQASQYGAEWANRTPDVMQSEHTPSRDVQNFRRVNHI